MTRLAALAAVAVLVAGCGGGGGGEAVETNEVAMAKSYRFEPERIAVAAGTTVRWQNDDNFTHTVLVEGVGREAKEAKPGESVSVRFDKAGTYEYVCTLHENDMRGTVVVR